MAIFKEVTITLLIQVSFRRCKHGSLMLHVSMKLSGACHTTDNRFHPIEPCSVECGLLWLHWTDSLSTSAYCLHIICIALSCCIQKFLPLLHSLRKILSSAGCCGGNTQGMAVRCPMSVFSNGSAWPHDPSFAVSSSWSRVASGNSTKSLPQYFQSFPRASTRKVYLGSSP